MAAQEPERIGCRFDAEVTQFGYLTPVAGDEVFDLPLHHRTTGSMASSKACAKALTKASTKASAKTSTKAKASEDSKTSSSGSSISLPKQDEHACGLAEVGPTPGVTTNAVASKTNQAGWAVVAGMGWLLLVEERLR